MYRLVGFSGGEVNSHVNQYDGFPENRNKLVCVELYSAITGFDLEYNYWMSNTNSPSVVIFPCKFEFYSTNLVCVGEMYVVSPTR